MTTTTTPPCPLCDTVHARDAAHNAAAGIAGGGENKMRCKHTTVEWTEEAVIGLHYTIIDDCVISDFAGNAAPTGRYYAVCGECHRRFVFTGSQHGWPKWSQRCYSTMRTRSDC